MAYCVKNVTKHFAYFIGFFKTASIEKLRTVA
jgi:hypothetical protein